MKTQVVAHSRSYEFSMADTAKGATATAFEVVPSVDIHIAGEPKTPEGIVDIHGDTIRRPGLVARLDDRSKEPITISKGLAWLVGTLLAVVPVGVMVIVQVVSGAMGYSTVINRVGDVEKRLDKMDTAVTELQGLKVTATAMQKDVETIKKAQESEDLRQQKMLSDVSDIRILLAQKGLQQ